MERLNTVAAFVLALCVAVARADDLEAAKAAIRLKDFAAAAKLLDQDRSPAGKYLLATLRLAGLAGSTDDAKQVRALLESAALAGEPRAALLLSSLSANEDPRDLVVAQRWLDRAAELHYPPAMELRKQRVLPQAFRPQIDLPDATARRDAFWLAAGKNDVTALQALHEKSLVAAPDEFGRTALHRAAASGAMQSLEWLLSKGAAVDAPDRYGVTALMLAAASASVSATQILLRANARTIAVDQGGNAPLAYAARGKRTTQIETLLAANAEIHAKNKNGWSALDYALAFNAPAAVELLRARGAKPARYIAATRPNDGSMQRPPAKIPDLYTGWSDLAVAVTRDDQQSMEAILGRDTSKSKPDESLLVLAAATASPNSVTILARKGVDVTAGGTPLVIAARRGDTDTVRALLASGARADAHDDDEPPPLIAAIRAGQALVVRQLLAANANADVSDRGVPALSIAAQYEQMDSLEALLAVGVRVDAADLRGRTPLWYAAHAGSVDLIDKLLHAGAVVDAADQAGVTPLLQACAQGHDSAADRLLAAGANARTTTKHGDTPLMAAAAGGRLDAARRLLAAKSDLDTQNNDGDTAMIFASRAGHEQIVAALLQAGASSQLRNKEKIAAEEIARARGFERIAQLIDRH